MRQAGRYLPEYCETRKRAGELPRPVQVARPGLRSHAAAAGPLSKLDAAILFSDILTVPDAMGLGL
jgi:uroporphyrinogen decarboxylase